MHFWVNCRLVAHDSYLCFMILRDSGWVDDAAAVVGGLAALIFIEGKRRFVRR